VHLSTLGFTGLAFLGSFGAGLLGALTGLGGGVVIVPLLTLAFGVDIRYAVGASLVSVIATSAGAGAAYVREGFTNVRLAMVLQIATTAGALGGALLAGVVSTSMIATVFGVVLLASAVFSVRSHQELANPVSPDTLAQRLRLDSSYPGPAGATHYTVHRVPSGFLLMTIAGALSGLLGIGSGAVKVLAMDRAMRLPFKVSTTTSNLMIGVTAAASAGVYLRRGYIEPGLAMPIVLGALSGATLGARVLPRAETRILRWLFSAVIVALGIEMISQGVSGRI
jgi:uncharacterized protein